MTQNNGTSKEAGLYAAISTIEVFKAKQLLGNHLGELVGIAETLSDHVDPDDDLVNEMSRDLLAKLRDLLVTETECRVVTDAGLALDAQAPLALTVYRRQCRDNSAALLGEVA